MLIVKIFFFFLIKSTPIYSDLFTSTTHLFHLLNTEIGLANQLELYLKKEYERLDYIEK